MAYAGSWKANTLTYALSVGVASVAATLPVGFVGGGSTARIVNTGSTNVFVVFGVGAQVAVLPVTGAPPTGQNGVMVRATSVAYADGVGSADSFAAIGDGAGPAIIYVQKGDGNGP